MVKIIIHKHKAKKYLYNDFRGKGKGKTKVPSPEKILKKITSTKIYILFQIFTKYLSKTLFCCLALSLSC